MNKNWEIKVFKKVKLKNPILIEGLPGIGNVGKVAMDVLIEDTKAEKIMSFFSYHLPNSVFVNEENLVELPKIEMFYKKINGRDFLFLTGDVQPTTEKASYEFSEMIVNIFRKFGGKKIITLGGIGLGEIPENPKVFITGNSKETVEEFKKDLKNINTKIFGVVGPIMGVSGLLLGLSRRKNINSLCLLAETFAHPLYLGLKGARAILNILDEKYKFRLNLKKMEKEIKNIDNQIKGISSESGTAAKYKTFQETNYIG